MSEHLPADANSLVITFAGGFDSRDYTAQQMWGTGLHELGAAVHACDAFDYSQARQVGVNEFGGPRYYVEWSPHETVGHVQSVIQEHGIEPSRVVFAGFAEGANDAITTALALDTYYGVKVGGVVAIAPTAFFDRPEPFGVHDYSKSVSPVELHRSRHNVASLSQMPILGNVLTCQRYENLANPTDGTISTIFTPQSMLSRYLYPFKGIADSDAGPRIESLSALLRTGQFALPTALIIGDNDQYVAPNDVRKYASLIGSSGDFTLLRGIGHDFRSERRQSEVVADAVIDKAAQIITTKTIAAPRSLHSMLVTDVSATGERPMEVIVLSAARGGDGYKPIVDVAAQSGTDVAILASHQCDPLEVARYMATEGASGIVTAWPKGFELPVTQDFATRRHPLVIGRIGHNLSDKRNLGLLLKREKTIFSDDDIDRWTPEALSQASDLLEEYDLVGFLSNQFPDRSVVYHAKELADRLEGLPDIDQVTISGNALAVSSRAAAKGFNDLDYNEDRKFVYPTVLAGKAAILGEITQAPYDPFVDTDRITQELFGDVLCDGLYFLLGNNVSPDAVGPDFWHYAIWRYGQLVRLTHDRLVGQLKNGDERIPNALIALEAAEKKLAEFTSAHFTSYLSALKEDTQRWQEIYAKQPADMTLVEAVAYHGLSDRIIEVRRNRSQSYN